MALDFEVKSRNISLKLPLFSTFPSCASRGVRSSRPSRKLILALVEGMYGSMRNERKRMKLVMTFRMSGVLNKKGSTLLFYRRILYLAGTCFPERRPPC